MLYLGPDVDEREAPPEVYRDAAYVEALRARAAVLKEATGIDHMPDIEAEVNVQATDRNRRQARS